MGVSYHVAKCFVGKPVICHCRDGRKHAGIVMQVTPQHLYLSPLPYGTPVSSYNETTEITEANQNEPLEIEPVQWGWNWGYPGAAVTTLALFDILALSLLFW